MSEEGVFLETTPTKQSVELELKSLQEVEALAEAKQEDSYQPWVAAAQQNLKYEKIVCKTDWWTSPPWDSYWGLWRGGYQVKDLKAEKGKYKCKTI